MFESAKDVTSVRLELRNKCGAFFQEGRDYIIAPRHVLYGATLCFSAYPDGRDGLCIRDFIPYRSRMYPSLSDGANGEGSRSEAEGKLDITTMEKNGQTCLTNLLIGWKSRCRQHQISQ